MLSHQPGLVKLNQVQLHIALLELFGIQQQYQDQQEWVDSGGVACTLQGYIKLYLRVSCSWVSSMN